MGEISLAHHGVLFLDEFPEFKRSALEALREPLESGTITIPRAAHHSEFPARYQLIGAINPCPCGSFGTSHRACRYTPDQITRYQTKLSGPLMDRIDLHVEVPALPTTEPLDAPPGGSTRSIRARCTQARERAIQGQGKPNQALAGREIDMHAGSDDAALQFLQTAAAKLGWSARGTHPQNCPNHFRPCRFGKHTTYPCGRGYAVPALNALNVLQRYTLRLTRSMCSLSI